MLTLSSFLALVCVYIFSDLYSAFWKRKSTESHVHLSIFIHLWVYICTLKKRKTALNTKCLLQSIIFLQVLWSLWVFEFRQMPFPCPLFIYLFKAGTFLFNENKRARDYSSHWNRNGVWIWQLELGCEILQFLL